MRNFPTDEYDLNELEELNAEPWMLDMLKKNPEYTFWGNNEDYMGIKNNSVEEPIFKESVKGLFDLDDYNEVVNFYFTIYRTKIKCRVCVMGYNEATQQLMDTWHRYKAGDNAWYCKLTQDEVDTLWEYGRLHNDFDHKPTAKEVNQRALTDIMLHDAINRHICVETRAKRLGVYDVCSRCGGSSYIYTEPKAKLGLQLWILHPRKGASRGMFVKNIEQCEVDDVIKYLKKAQKRFNDKFSKL